MAVCSVFIIIVRKLKRREDGMSSLRSTDVIRSCLAVLLSHRGSLYTPSFHTALEMLHSRVCNRMNTSFCWAERECEPK
jgi:hypothetical protein